MTCSVPATRPPLRYGRGYHHSVVDCARIAVQTARAPHAAVATFAPVRKISAAAIALALAAAISACSWQRIHLSKPPAGCVYVVINQHSQLGLDCNAPPYPSSAPPPAPPATFTVGCVTGWHFIGETGQFYQDMALVLQSARQHRDVEPDVELVITNQAKRTALMGSVRVVFLTAAGHAAGPSVPNVSPAFYIGPGQSMTWDAADNGYSGDASAAARCVITSN